MQIVHAQDVPLRDRANADGGRAGTFKIRRMLKGDPDSPGNFSLVIYYQDGSFYSPRHRHSFDQFRYQIEGEADFARNGKMRPGVLGYFPEGAYYGPTSGPAHIVAVLQFGGPSGCGYLAEGGGAAEELRKLGVFEKGIFRRSPGVPGKKNQDAYEAIWEHTRGRKLIYPKPQYQAPVMIDSNQFPWSPVADVTGVEEKLLGVFTNCRIRGARYKLAPGARFRAEGRGIYLVLSGEGAVEGAPWREHTVVYLDDGEHARFAAQSLTEIVLMGMTSVAQMAKTPDCEDALQLVDMATCRNTR